MNITCPQCGFNRNVASDKIPKGHMVAKCPKCQCRFRFSSEEGAGAILPPKSWNREEPTEEEIRKEASAAYTAEAKRFVEQGSPNPWEIAPRPDGWPTAFFQTLMRVMFQPHIFFRFLNPASGLVRPLGFFLLICIIQTLVERFWGQALYSVLSGDANGDPQLERLLELLAPETSIFISLLFRSGLLVLQLYIFSLLIFFAYRIIIRDAANFRLVFQIMAYSSAPWILCLVPAVGSLAGTLWGIGCVAIGCKTAFDLTWPQTLGGFLPVLLLLTPLLLQILRLIS